LTDVINRTHENKRYLPDIKLPRNLVATAHLRDVVKDATLIVVCVPHQVGLPIMKCLGTSAYISSSTLSSPTCFDTKLFTPEHEPSPPSKVSKLMEPISRLLHL
jgi:hypothetical protein